MTRASRKATYLKEREAAFNNDFGMRSKLPEYNALLDSNMRRYFENESVQAHLLQTGQIDPFGHILSLDKQRSRLRVIENEIARAERLEQRLRKEEDHARHLVQYERCRDIERRRDLESVARRREEKKIKLELDQTEREILGYAHLYSRGGTSESLNIERKPE
jgi:hypothetical protein